MQSGARRSPQSGAKFGKITFKSSKSLIRLTFVISRHDSLPQSSLLDSCVTHRRGPHGMTQQQRRELYLAKAKEAEDFATLCSDADLKESWLKIAAGYAELAKLEQPASLIL